MLILDQNDLSALLTMNEVIGTVETAFRLHQARRFRMPERLKVELPETNGTLLEMPCALVPGEPLASPANLDQSWLRSALGSKIVTVFPQNANCNLDAVQASYLLLDPGTGVPLALMDGKFITAIRTAATSAVATRYLGPEQPWRLAVFGTGTQALYHVEAMAAIGNIETVAICSRTEERARKFADNVSSRFELDCQILNADRAATTSNLICTCTTSGTPLFSGDMVQPGTHINALGAFTPGTRELDTETIRKARVVIDDEAGAGVEAGEVLIPLLEGAIDEEHAATTLAEVITGLRPGRQSAEQITVFKSCGLAFEDLVTAQLAYLKASRS